MTEGRRARVNAPSLPLNHGRQVVVLGAASHALVRFVEVSPLWQVVPQVQPFGFSKPDPLPQAGCAHRQECRAWKA